MPPPTMNMAAVPITDNAFISQGARRRMPRPQAWAKALVRWLR